MLLVQSLFFQGDVYLFEVVVKVYVFFVGHALYNRLVRLVVNEFYFEVCAQGCGDFFQLGCFEVIASQFVVEILLSLLGFFCEFF